MNKKEFTLLVKKHLAGNATEAEKRFIETYYEQMESGSSIEDILDDDEMEFKAQEMMNNIRGRMDNPVETTILRKLNWKKYAAVAAMLTAVLSLSLWFYIWHKSDLNHLVYTSYYAKPGNLTKIELSDGTLVWLNSESKLKCLESFKSGPKREVFLEGEAYFEVAKDKHHPFLVHTGNLTTKVLGTKFNVKAYHTNKTIEVTLLEGKVMLTTNAEYLKHKNPDTLYLKPNEKAYYSKDMSITKKSSDIQTAQLKNAGADLSLQDRGEHYPLLKTPIKNAALAASWKDGRLIFDREPLENVIEALSRKYNVSINPKEDLLHSPVTLDLSNEPIENILLAITKQLKERNIKGNKQNNVGGQFKKVGSKYYIE